MFPTDPIDGLIDGLCRAAASCVQFQRVYFWVLA